MCAARPPRQSRLPAPGWRSGDKFLRASVVLTLLVTSIANAVLSHAWANEWRVRQETDRMTGSRVWIAASRAIGPEDEMQPPFEDLKAFIVFGCDAHDEGAGIVFTKDPDMRKSWLRTRWDENVISMFFRHEHGSRWLEFFDLDDALRLLKRSKALLVEVPWHGDDTAYFNFSLSGSHGAIEHAQANCEALPARVEARARQEQLEREHEQRLEEENRRLDELRAQQREQREREDRAMSELMTTEGGEATPETESLATDEHEWILEACPRGIGPSLWKDCIRREIRALQAGIPDISHLKPRDQAWIRTSCPRMIGPALYRDCAIRELNALGTSQ